MDDLIHEDSLRGIYNKIISSSFKKNNYIFLISVLSISIFFYFFPIKNFYGLNSNKEEMFLGAGFSNEGFYIVREELSLWFMLFSAIVIPFLLTLFFSIFIGNSNLKNFICPNCLKTIETDKIRWTCPFCKREHHGSEITLFGECKCKGKVQFIKCYYSDCQQKIDLFAPYNEKELERQRYES